ncbi:MAG: NDP-sugar synthase [Bacteroidaceae bacterium]|jgi:NDP-sugar pyrophosphorylase family protein|nr:NDP-sugar synthase [Bacteroidaceae bacterium]
MRYAIIAAGEGSRLIQDGVKVCKPLVCLNREPMIDRLIRIFIEQGASEIVVIVNDKMSDVVRHVKDLQAQHENTSCVMEVVVKSTPSSMHSFYELSPYLENSLFCLTTVDTIFNENEFSTFIEQFKTTSFDGMMAVTDFVDDEKPLYVGTDKELNITGFYDEKCGCSYISGGIYCLKPVALNTLRRCMEEGKSRMRNFQRQLVADGLHLQAFPFKKILDVDHVGDIVKAEKFLKS